MILTSVSYPEKRYKNYPSIYADAYNVRDVLVKTGHVFLSEKLVESMKQNRRAITFTQRLDEESLLNGAVPKEEILWNNMLLQLHYYPELRKYYLVDVKFRNISLRKVVNLESAELFLDSEI